MNRKKILYRIMAAALVAMILVFLYSSSSFLKLWFQLRKEQQDLEQLAAWAETTWEKDEAENLNMQEPPDSAEQPGGIAPAPKMPDCSALYERNSDTAGWLIIPDTSIDYPVMQTPEEPEYYIHRNFEKRYAYCGLPFLDALCQLPQGPVLMIYGHHMKNGTMFADLMKYQEKQFAEMHPRIYFDSLSHSGVYEVFSAFYADMDAPEGTFRYESGLAAGTSEEALEYARILKQISLYDTGVMPELGEQILVLSTCSYHVADGRFVVAAVRRD